jgi:hypothetical protein
VEIGLESVMPRNDGLCSRYCLSVYTVSPYFNDNDFVDVYMCTLTALARAVSALPLEADNKTRA